jgi:Zn-finger nucleic acid-binding protein
MKAHVDEAGSKMMLTCPRCRMRGLDEIELGEVVVDRCTCCGGLWFDNDEISELLGRTPEARRMETTVPPESDQAKDLACPRCADVALRALSLAGQDAAARTVFRCASCSGTWVDRGELRPFEDPRLLEVLRLFFCHPKGA